MIDSSIEQLNHDARDLLEMLRRQARRPFVLEVTGTPKAGKTTLIGMVVSFFRQCGWRVHLVEERAGLCPLPMKGHFFFNTWTTGTLLAGLLDAVDRDDDLVILDRGLFDALVWLEIQRVEGQVLQEEADVFERFVLIERWRQLSDATCLVELDADEAMSRENQHRLLPRTGSIMNPKRLQIFNEALAAVRARHGGRFKLLPLANDGTAKQGAEALVTALLPRVRQWADNTIAVIRKPDAERFFTSHAIDWRDVDWSGFEQLVSYRRRSDVEHNDEWVQVLACGAQVYDGKPFLSIRRPQRGQAPNAARDNSGRLWQGCHVEQPSGALSIEELQRQLLNRLRADLHLGALDVRPEPLGLIWDQDDTESRHLGVVFKVPIEENVATFLDEREFRTNGRGYLVKSSFMDAASLTAGTSPPKGYTLEVWSRAFLNKNWLP
jgi:predicted NUDIX family phosphoesterase